MNLMKLRLLADVHISPLTVSELKTIGYEVYRITDFLSASASDTEIVELALQKEAVIITQYLDFSALVAQGGMSNPSIVSLRVSNASPDHISKILKTVLPEIETELEEGVIVSIEDTEYRLRKLPIG